MIFSRPRDSRITPEQAHRMVQDRSALLVDVRESDEYRAGHAPGAVHVHLSRLSAGVADVPGTDGDRRIVLVCRSGNRSRQAARLLAGRGVPCADVRGGMLAWSAAGLTVQDAHGATGSVI
ncbi:rhodanese-like domain-containing protein [Streptomyces sp. NPDC056653]|uniref:rhodanese-like domain-containing protein n=1 Tax=Streptomyces sp. NPDC056653 TaxID=3345894 RepID=UPI0036935C18